MSLTSEQERLLHVTLEHLEERVRDLRPTMATSMRGILMSRSALPLAVRRPVDRLLQEMLAEIRDAARQYALEVETDDPRRRMRRDIHLAARDLHEARTRLRELADPEATASGAAVDARLKALIDLTERLDGLLSCARDDSRASG